MAQLTNEQIKSLNEKLQNGAILVDVLDTTHAFSIKVNTECIVITSMLAEDKERSLLINLADVRAGFNSKREEDVKPECSESDNSTCAE